MSGQFVMAVDSRKKTHDEGVTHPLDFNDGLMIPASKNPVN